MSAGFDATGPLLSAPLARFVPPDAGEDGDDRKLDRHPDDEIPGCVDQLFAVRCRRCIYRIVEAVVRESRGFDDRNRDDEDGNL